MWLKALHLIFMVTWFVGLFYLPRLFVYHAMSDDKISHDRWYGYVDRLCLGNIRARLMVTYKVGFNRVISYLPYHVRKICI